MKMTHREFLTLLFGTGALGGLGYFVNRKLHRDAESLSWVEVEEDGEEPFTLPPEAIRPVFRRNGLIFNVNRRAKTVCAHDETTGELVWESHGEERFIVPGAAFPIDLTPEGDLWVANVGRKRLEQLDPPTGRFIASWEPQEPFGGCCNPVRFAALSGGRFVTMEKGVRQACVYLPSGVRERFVTRDLSPSEFDYFLYRLGNTVVLYDSKTHQKWEIAE